MREGILMTMKSLTNDFSNILEFIQKEQQKEEKIHYIDTHLIYDLVDAIKGKKVLKIQSDETKTTNHVQYTAVSIEDVYIDTDPKNDFVTYKFVLNAPFDGEKELVINVLKVEPHTNGNKYYLSPIEEPTKAYGLEFIK